MTLPKLPIPGQGGTPDFNPNEAGLPSLSEIGDTEEKPRSIYELIPELLESQIDPSSSSNETIDYGDSLPSLENEQPPSNWNEAEGFDFENSERENINPLEGEPDDEMDWGWEDESESPEGDSWESFNDSLNEPSYAQQQNFTADNLDAVIPIDTLAEVPESDEDEWSWEEIEDDDSADGFIDQENYPDGKMANYMAEPMQELPNIPESETLVEPEAEIYTEVLEDEPPAKKNLWAQIKSDFGGGSDEEDGKEEKERPSKEKKQSKPRKPNKIIGLLAWPYMFLSRIILKTLTTVLNVFAKVPIIGKLVAKILRASKALNIISMILPGVIILYGFTGILLASAPSSMTIDLPDQGTATFKNFKTIGNDTVAGTIENRGDVIADVDAVFKVYSYSPNLSKPGTWFKLQEVAECPSSPVSIDIDDSVEITANCPNFKNGVFTKVSGVLVE